MPDEHAPPPQGWPEAFAATEADRDALLALSTLTDDLRWVHRIGWKMGTASACLRAIRRGDLGDRLREAADRADPAALRRRLRACGGRMLAHGDPGYPGGLTRLPDPPAALFVRGSLPEGPAVTVVGARRCSEYGREIAAAIAQGLAAVGVAIVSGAAFGIDAASHRGALSARGPTVAVLGSGVDVPTPERNRGLIERIAERGAVVSEYAPGQGALPARFPARNRILAALARAVLVVEGTARSGALITARHAVDVGVDVLAVPGTVTSPYSEAPNALIRDGAGLVRSAADVLGAIDWDPLAIPTGGPDAAGVGEDEGRVLAAVGGAPMTLDAVARRLGRPTGEVLVVLVRLELRGLVRAVGGRWERTVLPKPAAGRDDRAGRPTAGSGSRGA